MPRGMDRPGWEALGALGDRAVVPGRDWGLGERPWPLGELLF